MKKSEENRAVNNKIRDAKKKIGLHRANRIMGFLNIVMRVIIIALGIWLVTLIDTYDWYLKRFFLLFWAMLPLWVLVAILLIAFRWKKLRFLDYAIIAVLTVDMLFLASVYNSYRAKRYICFKNIRTIGDSLEPYSYENDGFLPSPESWRELLKQTCPEVNESTFFCPLVRYGQPECQLNRNVAGLKFSEIPDGTVLIYVCVPYGSICDMYESDQATTKSCLSSEEQCYLYVKGDYTIKFVKPEEMDQWRWKP
jgi:hypothetical protein